MNATIKGDPELGPNAIGPADEHGIPKPGRLQIERASKPANLAIRTGSSSGLDDGFDGIDECVPIVHRYTGRGVGERLVLAGRGRFTQRAVLRKTTTCQSLQLRHSWKPWRASPMSDIPPKRLALEIDHIDPLVSELDGLFQRLPGSADGHDPASVRNDRTVVELLGPGVEDVNACEADVTCERNIDFLGDLGTHPRGPPPR